MQGLKKCPWCKEGYMFYDRQTQQWVCLKCWLNEEGNLVD
jgi:uncharacterized protein (DUF983 family)